ncbi:MAG: tRNA (N(6)-L-threonylcarbamoyladenosine(37)-C(2))-methylthiotransferase MtaB [Eubacteriales bacterium]
MNETQKTVGILTLGCKVNQYESEAIAEKLAQNGYTVLPCTEECDAYIINTCTVTAESDRKARQFIRRAIHQNPDAYILVTGCLAQVNPKNIAGIAGVDYVCGNSDKLLIIEALNSLTERGEKNAETEIFVRDIDGERFEQMEIKHFDRTRAYIKIEDGCESKCTYCIIPYARGKIRSKAPSEVIAEVRHFVENGCREVVLTGIETASYGKDLDGYTFADLLCDIDEIEGDFRVRLGSLDPSCLTEKFVDRIKNLKKLAPHFHISMQSGSSETLRNMKRKYNAEQALANMERLRAVMPDVRYTTDIIVGFPGESEENFAETLEFAKRANFLMIHVFPYSPREGTPAAQMKNQVPSAVKKARSAALIEFQKQIRRAEYEKIFNARYEQTHSVLFESYDDGFAYGHTPDFLEIGVKSDRPLHSEIHEVRISGYNGEIFFGDIIDKP